MTLKFWSPALFLIILPWYLWGKPLTPGDSFPDWQLKDQHGEVFPIPVETKGVIAAMEMGPAKELNIKLEEKGKAYLDERHWVVLNNVHGMPWIGRKFAFPKMREYPHRIGLLDSPELETLIPFEKDKVTFFTLEEGKITRVQWLSVDELIP